MITAYDLVVRLNLQVGAMASVANLAISTLRGIETAATRAEKAASGAFANVGRSHITLGNATLGLAAAQNAYNKALADAARINSNGAATPLAQSNALYRVQQTQIALQRAQFASQNAQNALSNAQGTYAATSAAALAAQQQQTALDRSRGLLASGVALTATGVGITAFLDEAVKKAMSLQTVMASVGMTLTDKFGNRLSAAGQTSGAEALRAQAAQLGLTHQMSETDVMRIVQSATQAGMTTLPVLKNILPSLTDYAEVLFAKRGYDVSQSATIAAEMAHIFGAWNASSFNQMTQLMGRALAISPASPQEFLNLTSQFAGTLRPLYGTGATEHARFITDAITTAALESELGQQTRGGTQLARLITRTLGGASRTSAQNRGLGELDSLTGMTFFNSKGQFKGVANAIEELARAAHLLQNPAKESKLFQDAFGLVGARQAGLLADPITLNRLGILGAMLGAGGLPSLSSMQQTLNATTAGQFNQSLKNLNTALTELGRTVLPIAADLAVALASITRGVVEWTQKNPDLLRFLGVSLAVGAALALIVGPVLMIAGAFAALAAIGGIAALGAGLLVALPVIAAFAVAVTAITLAIMNWKKIVDFFNGGSTYGAARVLPPGTVGGVPPSNMVPPHPGDRYNNGSWYMYSPPHGRMPGQWVLDNTPPPVDLSDMRSGMGHGGRGGGGGITIVNHFHGADHQTAEHLARHVVEKISRDLAYDVNYGSASPRGLQLSPFGF